MRWIVPLFVLEYPIKRQASKMKNAHILAISLLMVLVLLIGMGAGACGGGEVTTPGEEEEDLVTPTPAVFTSTPAGLACIEMMKRVPAYYKDSFTFWDVKTLRSDPYHDEMYQVFYDKKGDFLESWGIDINSVDYWVNTRVITLVQGDFDLDVIRGNMPADFARDTDYEALEVWEYQPIEDPQGIGGSVILAEGLLIRGRNRSDLDELLSVYEGEEPSLYNEDAVEILERLPETLEIHFGHRSGPERLIIEATAIVKEEAGTYRWISVYKFESPEYVASADAEAYFQRYEDSYREAESECAESGEPCPFHSFTLEKDGEFVEWSIIAEGLALIATIFYG